MKQQHYHPYHIVDPSPWPYIGACGALFSTAGFVVYLHYGPGWLLLGGLGLIAITMVV